MLSRAYNRLLKIAGRIYHDDFSALEGRHALESVVSETWMRLVGALEKTQPQTVDGFFGLVFHKVRQVLLDMAGDQRRDDRRRRDRQQGGIDPSTPEAIDRTDTTHDPQRLAILTEFHEQVEKLPAGERTVFELHYYGDFSQVEIAQMLGLQRKQVSRLWLAAVGRLARGWMGSTHRSDRPEEGVKRPMQDRNTSSQPETRLATGLPTGDDRKALGPRDGEDDPLLDPLEAWDERFRRGEDASPEVARRRRFRLGGSAAPRVGAIKRFYRFLKLPPSCADQEKAGASARSRSAGDADEHPAGCREPDERVATAGVEAKPRYIGRYPVKSVLGQGGFGRVFLAHDPTLDRDVAIKVPTEAHASRILDVEAYLAEARILARLSHPNIVPVYDVGQTEDGRYYVVSKYMEGGDLTRKLGGGRPSFVESASMIAVLCDALHYTHTKDLFHRDIKPANILLDSGGVPSLADFGLALRDENLGQGSRFAGTAAYMSPEQARGEGHLVDGRSDIFSIGIVFYELLTGRRPFRGGPNQRVLRQIVKSEPRPPRQIDDTIPRELERICLKALSKRASERYSTARDLAADLRHFLAGAALPSHAEIPAAAVPSATTPDPTPDPVSAPSESSGRSIRIIPKGIGSFDENDANFFPELLPGPRDRDGLPDGLRFWKTRIEATDPDRTFRVGFIYGPSGCGKSSLVKAGLLPRLCRRVMPVYLEATAKDTEARLLRGVRKLWPELPASAGLVGSLTILRRGQLLPPGHKALLVLDQFEQWLFARQDAQGTELVASLRQCDGEHLQALCLLRDDFWMAATRFMRDLDIDLVPDRNVAAVDLFDTNHARKVLAAYGRAYEALLPSGTKLTREQTAFLDQAVAGLAQDGRVVPVRLALFAEMVKSKPWTPATLKEQGGMDGVGVKFLEETFSSPRSSPKHHFHQKAAQGVLKALLPETSADIKGSMRSIEDLRQASGYVERPGDFIDLIRTLDGDLRLITPVDPEGSIDDDEPAAAPPAGRFYQLTHDYLVHSLRDWLTRKQRETRRGRAELLLADARPSGALGPRTDTCPRPRNGCLSGCSHIAPITPSPSGG